MNTNRTNRWLKQHLKENDYWLLPCRMAWIAKKLGLEPRHKSYYKRIFVWLPDDRWGEEAMPRCPNCRSNKDVGSHGFQSNHYGRIVVDMHENYFIMARRYICKGCKEACQFSVETAKAGQARGAEIYAEDISYTFMGYNPTSVALLPRGYGDEFPAILSHKAALDKKVIDLMRAVQDKGVRSESFSKMLLESIPRLTSISAVRA